MLDLCGTMLNLGDTRPDLNGSILDLSGTRQALRLADPGSWIEKPGSPVAWQWVECCCVWHNAEWWFSGAEGGQDGQKGSGGGRGEGEGRKSGAVIK